MPRWRQCRETNKLIPIDEAAIRRDGGAAIHGDIEAFVSPIDKRIISDRKQLREHNKEHGVVSAYEFTPEFYAEKAKERADVYNGNHSRKESFERKQEIYNNWIRAEREC